MSNHQTRKHIPGFVLSFLLLATVSAGCGEEAFAPPQNQETAKPQAAIETVALTAEQRERVRQFLFPLPQELRLRNTAFGVEANTALLVHDLGENETTKQMLADFSTKWGEKFAPLHHSNEHLAMPYTWKIVVGLVGSHPELKQAAEKGLIDAQYLAERPNPEQAYILRALTVDGVSTVYIAANAESGLYYGLLTCGQLLDSLSGKEGLIVPEIEIVDWPDVKWRGSWTVLSRNWGIPVEQDIPNYEKTIRDFSGWKYNLCEAWAVRPVLDKDENLAAEWYFPQDTIGLGKKYGVWVYPGTSHLTAPFLRNKKLVEKYPGIAATPDAKAAKEFPVFCLNAPKMDEIFDNYLVSLAKQFDFADLWLSEIEGSRGVCHCPKCKGDPRQAFLRETELLMNAYAKAKQVNPNFRIMLGLTQGSYDYNLELLKYVPKDVLLNFYHGTMTYKTTFQKYNLPPSVMEMQRMGYTVGSTPSPTASHCYQGLMMYPFQTPVYCKLLAAEAVDRGMEFVVQHLPSSHYMHDFNGQAMAEFLWNRDGRTPEQFALAWAVRKNLDQPEETARIIAMTEYAARGFSNGHGNNSLTESIVKPIVKYFTGKGGGNWPYKGFEFATHEEMSRVRAVCEEATARAKKVNNPELLAGCVIMQRWITILERYACAVENRKDEAKQKEALAAIQAEVKELSASRDAFYAFKKPYMFMPHWQRIAQEAWDELMAEWKPLLDLKDQKLSANAAELVEAENAGKLAVLPLAPAWRFATAPQQDGLEKKWHLPETADADWKEVRSDLGNGWESQGFPEYTGYGWYRQTLEIPAAFAERQHALLLFGAVDEDAEVFINGQPAFTHNDKTAGVGAGATWDRPFVFDAKPFLKPGEKNLVAVRVYNRAGMGGIWKPVTLVACDSLPPVETLQEFLAARKEK
jgi:hypothetical protein